MPLLLHGEVTDRQVDSFDREAAFIDHILTKIIADFPALKRSAMFDGGIRPHLYCLPVAKRERHRLALRRAATSGNPKFFLARPGARKKTCDGTKV